MSLGFRLFAVSALVGLAMAMLMQLSVEHPTEAARGGCAAEGEADGVQTPADVLHPNIHDKVGDGSNANPNGQSPAGGNEIHGIANVNGQDGDHPNADGTNGFANELQNVHGGIGRCNPNAA